MFSGRDRGFGDPVLEGALEGSPGFGEGRSVGDVGREGGVELG